MSTVGLQTVKYAAERLSVDLPRMYNLIRTNVLPKGVVVRLGRSIRIDAAKLEQFIAEGGAALPGGWRRAA